MFHLCAFSFTASNTGAGVFVTIPALADQYLNVNSNNRFIMPGPFGGRPAINRIAAGLVLGTGTSVARINNPTLRQIGLVSVSPIIAGAAITSLINVGSWGTQGPAIPPADEFGLEADNTGANVQTGLLWLHSGNMNVPVGPIYTLQFSATITAVLNTWTAGNITLTQTLPVGRYAVLGLDLIGTTLIAGRLVFAEGGPRPGTLGRGSTAILPSNQFRFGNFGNYGEFTTYAQPQLEILDATAGAVTVTGFMEVVKVG